MTKYILAGGADRKFLSYGQNLAAEVRKSITGSVCILSCFFAEPREDWEVKFADRQLWFRDTFGDNIEVSLAMPDLFLQQVKDANMIYLHGGDETLLAHYLDSFSDIERVWNNKTVIGTSAGAEYLVKDYWTCDWRQVRKGKGFVSLHLITHYESEEYGKLDPRGPIDWMAAKREVQAALNTDTEITLLHEGEFVVVEQ